MQVNSGGDLCRVAANVCNLSKNIAETNYKEKVCECVVERVYRGEPNP